MSKVTPTVSLQPGVEKVLSAVAHGQFEDLQAYHLQIEKEQSFYRNYRK
jgi:hypothetical protein